MQRLNDISVVPVKLREQYLAAVADLEHPAKRQVFYTDREQLTKMTSEQLDDLGVRLNAKMSKAKSKETKVTTIIEHERTRKVDAEGVRATYDWLMGNTTIRRSDAPFWVQLYREHFNAVDHHDRQFYQIRDKKSRDPSATACFISSLCRVALINAHTLYYEINGDMDITTFMHRAARALVARESQLRRHGGRSCALLVSMATGHSV